MQEKLIKLICAAYKLEELYMCDCGCDDDIMEEFILDINKIFSSVSEVKEAASYIKGLDLRVFTDEFYKNEQFNDEIRDAIEEVLRSDIESKKVIFAYDLVYDYIEYCSLLINYLEDISLEQLVGLASKKPSVLYLVDNFSIDTLKLIIKNNSKAALVLDVDVMNDDDLYDTYLYKNRDDFLKDVELYKLYINGLRDCLKEDRMKYIHMSKIARSDISLARFMLDIDSKFVAYTEFNVRNNKDIMLHIISIDKAYDYYLSDELRKDSDIQRLLNS